MQTAGGSWVIPNANIYALPKSCIADGILLRQTNCWLEKNLPLVKNHCFILRWLDLPTKTTPKNIYSVKICRAILAGITTIAEIFGCRKQPASVIMTVRFIGFNFLYERSNCVIY